MKILISNDDGVNAPGLAVLAESLADLGEVLVVAPDRDRSGASNSLTLDRPLQPRRLKNGFYAVNGTPTDCVLLAVSGAFDFTPDLVVSGINHGANLGDDVIYSGTVAAALEGRSLGAPALAISLVRKGARNYPTAGWVAKNLLEHWDELALPARTILNVNVPDLPIPEIKGWKRTRLGHRGRSETPVRMQDPRGKECFWIAAVGPEEDAGEGTDFHATANGYVSVTPLQVDMTRHEAAGELEHWVREIEGAVR